MFKKIFILTLLLLPSFISFSQKNGNENKLNDYFFRKAAAAYPKEILQNISSRDEKSVEKEVNLYLKKFIDYLKNDNTDIMTENYKESPGGYHFTFTQTFAGIKIYNAQIKINLNKKFQVRNVFDNSFDVSKWDRGVIEIQKQKIINQDIKKIITDRNTNPDFISNSSPEIFVELKSNFPKAVHHVIFKNGNEQMIDGNGKLLFENDLKSYFTQQDSVVKAFVFIPDPLTSANVLYGSPYVDAGDSDITELNTERKLTNITVNFQNDTFFLENNFVKIADFDAPNITPVFSLTPDFYFTRSQDGFEDVNVFHQISFFQNYIQSLGFSNLMNYQIPADVHAANGTDNSFFNPSGDGSLYFGEGGIDDGEDADVVIHEYGHAIANSASPNSKSGLERAALDEAFGDYLASSYSRSIDEFNWQKVFSWDGNNGAWQGRNVASSKHYPEDANTGNYYSISEIFSSVMMEIWTELGNNVTDKLMLQSAYSFANNMSLKDAAKLVVDADTALFSGANFKILYKYFVLRGLLDPYMCDTLNAKNFSASAGTDTSILCGENFTLGSNPTATGGGEPYEYRWFPSSYLDCDTCANPVTGSVSDIAYILSVLDTYSCSKTDTVTVRVLPNNLFLNLGSDTIICKDDRYALSQNLSLVGGNSPYTYAWSPTTGLICDDADCESPVLVADAGTEYTLKITDNKGCTISDKMYIEVVECIADIIIYNTGNFTRNGEPVYIQPPTFNKNINVKVFDLQGRLLVENDYEGDFTIQLSLNNFAQGMYFVKVKTDEKVKVKKIMKVK